MANFRPLKNYMFYCLDRLIAEHGIRGPFLDVGCGRGDLSRHLGSKGWSGCALDNSPAAVEHARAALSDLSGVRVEVGTVGDLPGSHDFVLAWDILEHVEDDQGFLRGLADHVAPGGHLLISTPSNPREWRWDDEFYGHYRRYTADDLGRLLRRVGLRPLEIFDFTYPVFWAMRRAYTRLKRPPREVGDKASRTAISSLRSAWQIPVIADLLAGRHMDTAWQVIYRWQYERFRHRTEKGWELFALATKD